MADLVSTAGDTFGFSGWKLGLGSIGNFMVWLFLVIFIVGGIIGFFIWKYYRKQFCYKVMVFKVLGNTPDLAWEDLAKEVKMGRAGDSLWFLRNKKRYLPPPELQTANKIYFYWEREDGELINVKPDNLDAKMKSMGLHFIHSDMRMQRLGIEKNLQFRLQTESFWEKYGDKIMNIAFYVLMMVVLVVLFSQLGKLGDKLGGIADRLDTMIEKQQRGSQPEPLDEGGSSGVIPALTIPLFTIGGRYGRNS